MVCIASSATHQRESGVVAIAIAVDFLGGVEREGIGSIRHAIAIVIEVSIVARAIVIAIDRLGAVNG